MSFEVVASGDPSGSHGSAAPDSTSIGNITKQMNKIDLEDITDLHHEVFGIASTLRDKIKKLGIERKRNKEFMTKEQCDNIAEHIDDINTAWNEQLQVALGKTNSDVFAKEREIRNMRDNNTRLKKTNESVMRYAIHLLKLLRKMSQTVERGVCGHAIQIATLLSDLRDENKKKKAHELITEMVGVAERSYKSLVQDNPEFTEFFEPEHFL